MSNAAWPATPDGVATLGQALVGAMSAWVVTPSLYLVGPLKYAAILWATASQEGAYQATIEGDTTLAEHSYGVLQFQPDTAAELGFTVDDAETPLTAGRMFAANLAAQPLPTLLLLWLPIPGLGYAVARQVWTHGSCGLGDVGSALSTAAAGLMHPGDDIYEWRGAQTYLEVRFAQLALVLPMLLLVPVGFLAPLQARIKRWL